MTELRARAWRWAWPAFLASSAAAFAYLEHAAYARRKHPTLSRCLARWLGVEPRNRWGRISPGLFLLFGAWLALHIGRIKTLEEDG